MVKYYSINSEIVPAAEASLKVTDLSILRGFGVFDFFNVREGVPVFLEDHLDRFEKSAAYLDLEIPVSRSELSENIKTLIRKNAIKDAGIRLVLTGGYSEDGYLPARPNLLILEQEPSFYDPAVYTKGVNLLLHKYIRETPITKTTNYLIPIRLAKAIKAAGAMDVLYYWDQKISESSRSNFFIVTKDKTILTPKENILEGVTRKQVIRIAQKHCELIEKNITLEMLFSATEAFITSTTKGVMPVVQLGDQIIGNGAPGPITKKLAQLLKVYKKEYIAEHKGKVSIE